jgi:hypothetical protein
VTEQLAAAEQDLAAEEAARMELEAVRTAAAPLNRHAAAPLN